MFREKRRPEKGFHDIFEEMIEDMNESINRTLRSMSNEPFVYGFSFQVGPDGVPHVEHFGNTGGGVPPFMGKESEREPFISSMVDEKNNEFKITAEMPGVEKKDIEVNATEDEVTIKAESEGRKYRKDIRTPHPVDPDSSKAKYNNGILEVSLKLKEPSRPTGKQVKIE